MWQVLNGYKKSVKPLRTSKSSGFHALISRLLLQSICPLSAYHISVFDRETETDDEQVPIYLLYL